MKLFHSSVDKFSVFIDLLGNDYSPKHIPLPILPLQFSIPPLRFYFIPVFFVGNTKAIKLPMTLSIFLLKMVFQIFDTVTMDLTILPLGFNVPRRPDKSTQPMRLPILNFSFIPSFQLGIVVIFVSPLDLLVLFLLRQLGV